MSTKEIVMLNDWMTSPEMPFHSKITENGDNNIYHSHDFYEIFYILEGSIIHDIGGEKCVHFTPETLDLPT